MPVEIVVRKETIVVAKDEEPPRFNEQKLRALRPAFDAAGTVTAGNASSLNDGAAAVVVLSADRAGELGVRPQARILGYATFSREPEWFTLAPIGAIRRADGMSQAGGRRRGPVRDQRSVFRGALGGDEGAGAARTRKSTSTAAPSPWDIPSAPAAPASWPPCCTRWSGARGRWASPRCASAAARRWPWRSAAATESTPGAFRGKDPTAQ